MNFAVRTSLLLLVLGAAAAVDPIEIRELQHLHTRANQQRCVRVEIFSPIAFRGRLDLSTDSNYGSRVLDIPAGNSSHWVLLPPQADSNAKINGVLRDEQGRNVADKHQYSQIISDQTMALVVQAPGDTSAQELRELVARKPSSGSSHSSLSSTINDLDPAQLPDRWQGLPVDMAIILGGNALKRLAPGQIRALAIWSRHGGKVWTQDAAVPGAFAAVGGQASVLSNEAMQARIEGLDNQSQPVFPTASLPGLGRPPLTAFVAIALLFAILVGPVSLWLVKRSGRPVLFLVLTPTISLGCCVVLVLANTLHEGVSAQRSTAQLLWLDGPRSSLWCSTTIFAPFGGEALELPPDAKLIPANPGEEYIGTHGYCGLSYGRRGYHDSSLQTGLSLEEGPTGLKASGGWAPARLVRRLTVVDAAPRRERLQVRRSSNGYEVINGLGADITRVAWREEGGSGAWWSGGAIPAGGVLRLQPGQMEGGVDSELPAEAVQQWTEAHERGSFRAVLAGLPAPHLGHAGKELVAPKAWACGRAQLLTGPEAAP